MAGTLVAAAGSPRLLSDDFGRIATKLRISITDRCNLRCLYCMPARPQWLPRPELLTFDEIERLVRVACSLGVEAVRITGGEPTARRDLPVLVRRVAAVPGLRDLSLTTNGILLKEFARPLRDAGLHRLNVSLDTLRQERFVHISRRDGLGRVFEGLEAAARAGFERVKINMVVMRGVNDDEVVEFAGLARSLPWEIRFIEFMPLDGDGGWSRSQVVPAAEILARIAERWPLEPSEPQGSAPARLRRFRDGRGTVGVIASVTEPFCDRCDRMRITPDGKLRPCLFSGAETDLRSPLRSGASPEELALLIRGAMARKGFGHGIGSPAFHRPEKTMHQLGG